MQQTAFFGWLQACNRVMDFKKTDSVKIPTVQLPDRVMSRLDTTISRY